MLRDMTWADTLGAGASVAETQNYRYCDYRRHWKKMQGHRMHELALWGHCLASQICWRV